MSPANVQGGENEGEFGVADQFKDGFNQQLVYQFHPEAFLTLQCGTNESNPPNITEAIVFNNGKLMKHNGKLALLCGFTQQNFFPAMSTARTEQSPFARNWCGHVDWRDVVREMWRDSDAGMDEFYRWANFWMDGTFNRRKPGGEWPR
jgi:hypothetical protein